MGSKKYDPEKIAKGFIKDTNTRSYNAEMHFGAFAFPNFVKEILR